MNLPLRPSQIDGVDFLSARSVAILADDAGLGKSAQAIRAADKIGARRILVICKAIGRVSWAIEAPKWQTTAREVTQFTSKTKALPFGPCVVIAAYDTMSRPAIRKAFQKKLYHALMFGGFDLVILDEAQDLASPTSARTKSVYGKKLDLGADSIIRFVVGEDDPLPRVWLLTASLHRKDASELYTHLAALFPGVIAPMFNNLVPRLDDFVAKFCHTSETPFGTIITGNDPVAIAELREALRPFTLRRSKKDVAKELGEVQHITLPFDVDMETPELERVMDTLETFDPGDMVSLDDPTTPAVNSEWHRLGLAKADPAVQWATDFLEANPDQKLIIFAHHRDVIERVFNGLARFHPAILWGGQTTVVRSIHVNRFQTDPLCRVVVGQTVAAGTSITLTAASNVLLLEPEGVPEDNNQAISRAHRIGQTEPVTAWWAYAAGTADARYASRARRRAEDFDQLIGALTTTPGEHQKETP